jgi:hypothetical protein
MISIFAFECKPVPNDSILAAFVNIVLSKNCADSLIENHNVRAENMVEFFFIRILRLLWGLVFCLFLIGIRNASVTV